ncbi:MAG: hypothetical protein APF76_03645 [Desulfitibacter sp. BRH_c19]|nr:MAG: hypothetical protein APF76_03645 [Desulfitibacter sp. BRH_c19]
MKRGQKIVITIIIVIGIVVVYLHFAPVSFDASACGGGYKRWVADSHSEGLINLFIEEKGLDKGTNLILMSKPSDIADTVNWNGRDIYATIELEVDGRPFSVSYSGKRYWIEKYAWKIDNIVSGIVIRRGAN